MKAVVIAFVLLAAARPVLAQRPMGTDVSSYQGSGINWATVKSDGVSFAWTKATEGTYYIDADFTINESHAKSAGVLIGAYHFARPSDDPNITGATSADTEATYFWNEAGGYVVNGGSYCVPMLDWEDVYVTNAGLNFTATKLSQWVNEWCTSISNTAHSSGVTLKPVVYTGTWFSSPGTYPGLTTAVTGWPNWMASYPSCTGNACGYCCPQTGSPSGTYPWSSWNIWQYGDTNWSGGDSDVFNGTQAQFNTLFVIGSSVPTAPAGVTIDWDPGAKKASPGSGGTGNWDTFSGVWWQSGTNDLAWNSSGDNAVFAGTAGTVTITSSVSADSMTFNTTGYNITGSGTLTLSGTNTTPITVGSGISNYIGCVVNGNGYTLSGGGTMVLTNAGNACGSSASPEIVNGPNTTLIVLTDHDTGNTSVPLDLQNGGIYQDNDATANDQFLLPGCTISLLTGGGILSNPNASLTLSNLVSGAGSLTFTGNTNSSGTPYVLTLTSAANSYSGGTIVQGPGELKANAAGTLGSTSGALTVNGGILDLNAVSQTVGAVVVTGGKIQNGTLIGSSYNGQGGSVTAVLAGSASLTKTGSNTFTLSGANTFSGTTSISGGLLQVSSDANLGAAPGSPIVNKIILNNGGISSGLRNTASYTMNANRGITLTGPNGGSIQSTSGQTVTYPNVISGNGNLGIGSAVTLGYGVTVLNAANTYTGATTIAAGTLRLGRAGALPAGTPLTIAADGNGTGGGGLFDMNTFSQTIGPLASSPGIGGTGTDIPTISLTGALTIIQTNVNTTFSGNIIGSGGSLTLTGHSTLTLAGTNTYTGATVINGGTLALAATGSINNTPSISIGAGGTLDVSAPGSFALGSATLSASGNAAPATIVGGTSVDFGSQPITLAYDGSHPALTISQGTLSLNGNAFTVNGPVLPGGIYTLVQQASGNISIGAPLTVSGTALPGPGPTVGISVVGGSVVLSITYNTSTTLGNLSPATYGQNVTFLATVAPAPPSGNVQFYDNSVALGAAVPLSAGAASYSTTQLAVGMHPITAYFVGINGYPGSSSLTVTQEIDAASLSITALAQSTPYGTPAASGAGSTNFTSTGLQNGETIGSVTLAISGNGGSPSAPVGTYTITPSAATGGTFLASDYNITYNPGTLTVTLPPNTIPVTILDILLLTNGTVQLDFAGTPGYVYTIQAAPDLTPPINWTAISTNAADTNGSFSFIDNDATNYPGRFYRTMAQ
jgi:autotransporter-associated beta strand protein